MHFLQQDKHTLLSYSQGRSHSSTANCTLANLFTGRDSALKGARGLIMGWQTTGEIILIENIYVDALQGSPPFFLAAIVSFQLLKNSAWFSIQYLQWQREQRRSNCQGIFSFTHEGSTGRITADTTCWGRMEAEPFLLPHLHLCRVPGIQ